MALTAQVFKGNRIKRENNVKACRTRMEPSESVRLPAEGEVSLAVTPATITLGVCLCRARTNVPGD